MQITYSQAIELFVGLVRKCEERDQLALKCEEQEAELARLHAELDAAQGYAATQELPPGPPPRGKGRPA